MHVEHHLARNEATDNIVVELTDRQGRRGYGEGVPRQYVTGEKSQSSLEMLGKGLLPRLMAEGAGPDALWSLIGEAEADRWPAAVCAVETALLDLAGQAAGKPLAELLCPPAPCDLAHSAIVPMVDPATLPGILAQITAMGLKQVKVKVGRTEVVEQVAEVRSHLGPGAELRVDANGAWSAEEAVAYCRRLERLGVEAVEQPVAKQDFAGLAKVKREVSQLIIADESLCTPADARRLIEMDAVGGFNLRLSKCGGPTRTGRLWAMAEQAGIKCQLGCQVGELGVLSALGRHFAQCHPGLIYLEGSLTGFIVGRDILAEDLTFAKGGKLEPLCGAGLGVTVVEERLADSLLFEVTA